MDFELPLEHQIAYESAFAFARDEIKPYNDEIERTDDFPPWIWKRLAEPRYSSPTAPLPTCSLSTPKRAPRLAAGALPPLSLKQIPPAFTLPANYRKWACTALPPENWSSRMPLCQRRMSWARSTRVTRL